MVRPLVVTAAQGGSAPPATHARDLAVVPFDEARAEGGRPPYPALAAALGLADESGVPALHLAAAARAVDRVQHERGVVFTAHVDGVLTEQAFPLDPVPRLLTAPEWDVVARGAEQRVRALNAFLGDVYGAPEGRLPDVVRAGVVPQWLVEKSPGYRDEQRCVGPREAPYASVAGLDLLRVDEGGWVVLEDNLRVPSGIGYSMSSRRTCELALPALHAAAASVGLAPQPLDGVPGLLRSALVAAAPRRPSAGVPQVVVLSDGPDNTAWFEHRLLARELGVPVVTPADLRRRGDRVAAVVDGEEVPVDVCYRRLDEDDLPALVTAEGDPLDGVLTAAVRAGTLTLANALGNGVADDKATYAWVPAMIRHYLGEEPLLPTVPTWVLADPQHHREARERLGELVVKPVDGYGGQGVVFGSHLDPAGLRELLREVDAAPHRFIAQEPVLFSTHPTVSGDALAPRHVDLRVFVVAGERTTALPALLTRVALGEGSLLVNSSQGGGSKDTWIVGG